MNCFALISAFTFMWMADFETPHLAKSREQRDVDLDIMKTSSNGNIFRLTGPLCDEFTGHRRIPRTKASDAELRCFLWSAHWINGWVNIREAADLRRHRAHYDVIVMIIFDRSLWNLSGVSAVLPPRHLSNFKTIWKFERHFERFRDFTRSYLSKVRWRNAWWRYWHRIAFSFIGPLYGESMGHRWFTKAH